MCIWPVSSRRGVREGWQIEQRDTPNCAQTVLCHHTIPSLSRCSFAVHCAAELVGCLHVWARSDSCLPARPGIVYRTNIRVLVAVGDCASGIMTASICTRVALRLFWCAVVCCSLWNAPMAGAAAEGPISRIPATMPQLRQDGAPTPLNETVASDRITAFLQWFDRVANGMIAILRHACIQLGNSSCNRILGATVSLSQYS